MRNAFATLAGTGLTLMMAMNVAAAADVKVLTAGALQTAMRSFATAFERETGNKVTVTSANPTLVARNLAAGQFDVVAAATSTMAEFDEDGRLAAGTHAPIARTGIGIAIREGAPKPDLSSIAAFKKAVMAAKNVIYTDPMAANSSGGNTQRILINAGLLEAVKAKGLQEGLGPGRERIAKGEYEMGFFNLSEAATAPGVVLAGAVPAPLQQYINYDIAVVKTANAPSEAAAFAKFLTAKGAAERWKALGLEQLAPQ